MVVLRVTAGRATRAQLGRLVQRQTQEPLVMPGPIQAGQTLQVAVEAVVPLLAAEGWGQVVQVRVARGRRERAGQLHQGEFQEAGAPSVGRVVVADRAEYL